MMPPPDSGRSVFRLDTFLCPAAHVAAFAERLATIHGYVGTLDGCLYNRVLVAHGTPVVKIATLVEWRDAAAMAAAKTAMADFHAKEGFDPARFMAELEIIGEFGSYHDALYDGKTVT
ncbi:hypothetical protein [Rhizobium halophytocola]|uniref:Antibiotic biosynthesis monooxygenase n=1 Tax=Rhizobium halophytocola TaxID=735519 RepID=A0ABS4DXN7_9HYPH|nr:hypothetical protein [Rhizobium halophytocola]MBP1850462.1 hypothetical protein [Rhizobium halophytocola]